MQQEFFVTGLGLKIDKVMIMPGSELKLSGPAPGHWSRFGTSDLAEAEAAMEAKKMVVATPTAAIGDGSPDNAPSKTKKRLGLEKQAADNDVEFTDEMSDEDLAAAIKTKKDTAKT